MIKLFLMLRGDRKGRTNAETANGNEWEEEGVVGKNMSEPWKNVEETFARD